MTGTRPPLGEVLVIIPTYNESENIESIVRRLRKAVPAAHVLIVDDNSPDGTGALADGLAAADDHVHVLHRQGKEGLGAAYKAGFKWGLDHDYGVLVEHDADGSHQPEQLPLLLEALKDADMVKGSRWVKGGTVVNWPKTREFLSRGGSLYTRLMLGMPVKDITGGLNALRADTVRAIWDDPIDGTGYGIQRDLTWNAYRRGFKIVEVPIEFKEREYGQSKMSSTVLVEALKRTTQLGVAHRLGQLRGLATDLGIKVTGGAAKAATKAAAAADDANEKLRRAKGTESSDPKPDADQA